MTDNEIIKALEYCSTDVRENTCPTKEKCRDLNIALNV